MSHCLSNKTVLQNAQNKIAVYCAFTSKNSRFANYSDIVIDLRWREV